ncbi:MAG: hypothetical protein E7325_04610 [Clostridiales bacterium]|nr:hypothetical protein [Clostridiales bacterium]
MRRFRRKAGCLLMALLLLPALTGCTRVPEEEREPAPALSVPEVPWAAPDGDGVVGQERVAMLYLNGTGSLQMIPREITLPVAELHDLVKTLVTVLMNYPTDSEIAPWGGERTITLYGDQPVEVSGSICTVNLGTAALQLGSSDFYQMCVGLATTLCSLDEISFVNVLVADQSVGLDVSGTLPMGSLTGHPDENLPVLWEQMEAKRTPLGEDASQIPLSAMVTLYYPLTDGQGIGCENRILNFGGQTPSQVALGLLQAIGDVRKNQIGTANLPDLAGVMSYDPLTSELTEGGKLVTLSFRREIDGLLEAWQTDLASLAAAVTMTLTTFMPGVSAVSFRVEDSPLTELRGAPGQVTALGGLFRRNMFQSWLRGSAVVYFARDGKLKACQRPMNRQRTGTPRALLTELMNGPTAREKAGGMEASMPPELREDDILGIAAVGDTLLINLSESFRSSIQAWGREREAVLCYSMINTLGMNCRMSRICFFFEGKQEEYIAGDIYWAGEFLYNPELGKN